ncbi:hypothetical protein M514_02737 [Trichuris suis]|uniref:Histone-lysine N-methyltransferase SETMAR n=1 Tax=Trichuris suis TaxID=68888 RepID=A0A085MGD6_9BILA|nr:hypothetical protein M513_02737 [Trichuris suis]KFD68788.1 hypothetical protein M514_02737 [Trichuris suis]
MSIAESLGEHRRPPLKNEVLKETVEERMDTTTCKLAEWLGDYNSTVCKRLVQTGKAKKLPKSITRELTKKLRKKRVDACVDLLLLHAEEAFLDTIITCDEKWCLYDSRKCRAPRLDKHEPPKAFPQPNPHPKKVLLSVWWRAKRVIRYQFFKSGETITADVYCGELVIMLQKLQEFCPAFSQSEATAPLP